MFQEKEIMEYRSQSAPEELKNRIWSSIELEKRRVRAQRQKWVAAAACFAGVLLAGNIMYQRSAVVKINDVPISYFSVSVEETMENVPALVSEGRNKSLQGMVPLELQVRENAHIKVSEGNLCTDIEGDAEAKEVMEMEIAKDSVVYWYVDEQVMNAHCTITTEIKEYHYVMEKESAGWKIRLEETK